MKGLTMAAELEGEVGDEGEGDAAGVDETGEKDSGHLLDEWMLFR